MIPSPEELFTLLKNPEEDIAHEVDTLSCSSSSSLSLHQNELAGSETSVRSGNVKGDQSCVVLEDEGKLECFPLPPKNGTYPGKLTNTFIDQICQFETKNCYPLLLVRSFYSIRLPA